MSNDAAGMDFNTSADILTLNGYTAFCETQDIEGTGSVKCPDLGENCYVTFANLVQKKVTCPT